MIRRARIGSLLPVGFVGVAIAAGCAPDQDLAMGSLFASASDDDDQQAQTCGAGPTVKGIDVSKWQGTINWDEVKNDGVEFAIMRVSDGTSYVDDQFARNWREAKRVGIVRGAYQFFRSDDDTAEQAQMVIDAIGTLEPGDLPPTIDLESDDGVDNATRIARVHQWVDTIEAFAGAKPFIYSGKYWWQDHMGTTEFNDHPLWHAQYTSAACPTLASQWPRWDVWQYTSTGRVAGISGNVDTNHFNGTRTQLDALRVGTSICGDGTCSSSESPADCPADCPVCEALPSDGGIVDDDDECFTPGGPPQFMRAVTDAGEGGLIWTHTTDHDTEANFGQWNLTFEAGGHYLIEARTDARHAQSRQAPYRIRHNGADDTVVVDQSSVDGWVTVSADVVFAAGADQFVHLGDNTGEPGSGNVKLVFDALRFTRLDEPVTPTDPVTPDEPITPDEPAPDEPGDPAAADDLRRIVIVNRTNAEGGCSATPTALPAMLLALLWRRRRLPQLRLSAP
jgi:GH25 family lysozyme M1 (1,4-beta-N-acetylmuramidase)